MCIGLVGSSQYLLPVDRPRDTSFVSKISRMVIKLCAAPPDFIYMYLYTILRYLVIVYIYEFLGRSCVLFHCRQWGNCVEAVIMEKTAQGVDPMYGRVVFKSISVIPLILNGNSTAKFVINGKHLRARIFVPKNI